MYLSTIKLSNYRRLAGVRIDLESDISIFVGANNSGKGPFRSASTLEPMP